ncbi:hypothetical protein HBH53_042900 [Parastagonospora nodorum]|nr:hypothetical protein HBH53_042900 [Parastagonospora nodorum]KAH4816113.1 hypothetical protein HBH61_064030 [Parastagonospora nodorum]KAH5158068.1 hypothetical protein HBH69_074370 [Parastagonospora nodorum]KAH5513521.1 hypothetical protein HBI31_021330 [Parastagonospora nodorum]KAH5743805.1 hypothetical protein HBI18_019930 [Parastagonospora nodorum]
MRLVDHVRRAAHLEVSSSRRLEGGFAGGDYKRLLTACRMKIQISISNARERERERERVPADSCCSIRKGCEPTCIQHARPATCTTNTTAPGSGCTNNRMQILIERSLQFALDEKLQNLDTHGDLSPTLISRVRR